VRVVAWSSVQVSETRSAVIAAAQIGIEHLPDITPSAKGETFFAAIRKRTLQIRYYLESIVIALRCRNLQAATLTFEVDVGVGGDDGDDDERRCRHP
jgi:hypothetical protein